MENFTEYEDLRRLYRRISSRIKNIENLDLIPVGYSAVNAFKKVQRDYGTPNRKMDDKTLRSMYRDLKYIDSLKTSTYKGALEANESFKDISGELESFSPNTQNKFWSIYNRLYERTGSLIEAFKYDAFTSTLNELYSGDDVDTIVERLYNQYIPDILKSGDNPHNVRKYSKGNDRGVGLKLPYT